MIELFLVLLVVGLFVFAAKAELDFQCTLRKMHDVEELEREWVEKELEELRNE